LLLNFISGLFNPDSLVEGAKSMVEELMVEKSGIKKKG
jgi:hypothetical protein